MSSPATTALRTVRATRYAAPLREGGSLPALVEADDDGLYVVKMRGAGQGPKALVAEVIAGELARRAGLAVPEIVLVELDAALAPAEPDQEIQDLLRASIGAIGIDFDERVEQRGACAQLRCHSMVAQRGCHLRLGPQGERSTRIDAAA